MKKRLSALSMILFFCGSTSIAQAKIIEVKPSCDNVKISVNTVRNDRLNFSAYWNDPSVFPEPPKYVEVGDTIKSNVDQFKFNCPDFSVSYDGNIAEIKSSSIENALKHISEYDRDLNLYFHGWYQYPNIKKGFASVGYAFDIDTLDLKTSIFEAKEGSNLSSDIKFFQIPKTAIIGYKVDGSELKPLLYDRNVSYYKDDMREANVIDMFHKNNDEKFRLDEVIQRIHIDKANGLIKIYRKYPFPSK